MEDVETGLRPVSTSDYDNIQEQYELSIFKQKSCNEKKI